MVFSDGHGANDAEYQIAPDGGRRQVRKGIEESTQHRKECRNEEIKYAIAFVRVIGGIVALEQIVCSPSYEK
jgi:hypothetical protein